MKFPRGGGVYTRDEKGGLESAGKAAAITKKTVSPAAKTDSKKETKAAVKT